MSEKLYHPVLYLAAGGIIGILVGIAMQSSHKPRKHSRLFDHCHLSMTGNDGNRSWHQLDCDSGTWKVYGDTLRVRVR